MAHVKRLSSPKTWPVPRKGTKYLTSPMPGRIKALSVTLTMALRDILGLASTSKEVRSMIHGKEVLVNGENAKSYKDPIGVFDVLGIPKIGKNYVVVIGEDRKIGLEEFKGSGKTTVRKVVGKTSLKGGKTQLNLFDSWNILSDMKVKVNDSVVLDVKKKQIIKHLPFKEGAKVHVIGGTHQGYKGVVDKVSEGQAEVKIGDKVFQIKKENLYISE